jgi:hypothetical protein
LAVTGRSRASIGGLPRGVIECDQSAPIGCLADGAVERYRRTYCRAPAACTSPEAQRAVGRSCLRLSLGFELVSAERYVPISDGSGVPEA